MTWLRPDDDKDVVYEFFAPFAHVPGKYEWCRIRSPTHGVFDCFILLGTTTAEPATVYVNSEQGERFMRERYPECEAIRVGAEALQIHERDEGRTVEGTLRAHEGPVREVGMTLSAPEGQPANVPYGGEGKPVWGGRFTCWGVDLVLHGEAEGTITWAEGAMDFLGGEPCIVTLGSFGRIATLPGEVAREHD